MAELAIRKAAASDLPQILQMMCDDTIENIQVAKDRQNSGIGTQLMEYAIDLAKRTGAPFCS